MQDELAWVLDFSSPAVRPASEILLRRCQVEIVKAAMTYWVDLRELTDLS